VTKGNWWRGIEIPMFQSGKLALSMYSVVRLPIDK